MDDSFDREQKGDSATRFNRPKIPSKRKPLHNTSAKEDIKSKSARLSPEVTEQRPDSCPYNLRSRNPVPSPPSRGRSARCLSSRTSTQTTCSEVVKLQGIGAALSQTPVPSSVQENKGNQELSGQPEPEGPRRSERIKKATGSCASNSRRGSQTRKQSWTRRSSASMSAEQDGRGEQGASAANVESTENEEESHSLFENAELKDARELSRLHSLLEARGIPPHLLGSLGPRMHQLLSRTLSGSSGGKVQQLLTGIQSPEEGVQLQAVIEMCQFLVMGNEESLAAFPVKEVVPALVNLLSMEHNFDMMNHACRSLTYLMEALPRSTAVVVEAVPVFIEKVQVIQCMDVAEQALAALEMLSRRNGKAILQAGGMSACLLYLDFFSITAQRSALAVAANCCQNVSDFHAVSEAIPVLSARLQNQDKKSVDSCCLAFSRLVEVFHSNEKHLQEIASHGLLSNLQQLLIVTPPVISAATFVMVLHLLAVVCANSPSLAATLLKQNISDTLQYLLVGTMDVMEANMELLPRIPQEFFELTCIVSELLPSLPSNGIFTVDSLLSKNRQTAEQGLWQWRDDRGIWHTYSWIDSKIIETAYQRREDEVSFTVVGRPYNIDFNTMQQINEDTGTARPVQRSSGTNDSNDVPPKISVAKTKTSKEDERLKALYEDKDIASGYFSGIFAVLYSICDSTVGPAIKHKCMNAILRMLYYSPSELLDVIVKKHRVSSLIGGMLKSQDLQILVNALQMAEILMQKLPEAFHVSFRREGVMHKIHDIAHMWSKEQISGNDTAAVKESPLPDVKPQCPENSSLQPRRLGDILRRKRRSKRAVMKGKVQDANSNSKKSLEDDFHPIEPRDCSFSINHDRMLSELTSLTPESWGSRTLGGTLSAPVSERTKFELGTCAATPSNKAKVRLWIKDQAEKFCVTYFDKDRRETHPALDIMHRLRSAAEGLSPTNEDSLSVLKEVCKCVSESSDSACTFEILHSGLLPRLLSYLSSTSSECVLSLGQRLKLFLCAFMDVPLQHSENGLPLIGEKDQKHALIPLLQKLHSCTNQLEQFPVNLNDTLTGLTGAGASRGSQALRFFSTHQIKCQLQRHPSCVNVKQWKRGPVKIDPLALVQAIERYLVVRGFGRPREGPDDDGSEDDGSDDDIDESMMKELQSESSTRHHVEILLGDHVLPYNMTVYQCIKQYGQFDEERDVNHDHGILGRPSIWIGTHTIWYRLVNTKEHSPSNKRKVNGGAKAAPKPCSWRSNKEEGKSSLAQILSTCVPSIFIAVSDPCLEAVCLMKALHALNSSWVDLYRSTHVQEPQTFVSSTEFINHKLTTKVTRQLQDPITVITGNFPSWLNELPTKCPFLFPFECRQQLFFCTAFDRDRAMIKLGETVPDLISTEVSDRVAPRIDRKKLKVSREGLFDQAEKLIENLGGSSSVLEVHYEGEVGTGLGPTLEFYALVSREFQSSTLEMWQGQIVPTPDEAADTSYVFSSTGLFPAPLPRNARTSTVSKICSKFTFLGKFLARALMDFRMVDIPLSRTFYKWLLGQEDALGLKDFEQVDTVLAQSVGQLYEVVLQKKRLEEDPEHTPQSLELAIDNLTLEGDSIEDFGFVFVLPGYHEIELKKHGKDTPVTIRNLEEYIELVIHWSLVEGVRRQFEAFKEGFESVFTLSRLSIFTPLELELLMCGSAKESWDFKSLVKSCRPDHGYTQDSPTIKFLYEILVSYSSEEQRLFLQFVTGSPRLPVGGLRSLHPPLTIVRKTLEAPLCADNYLPSVMTCVNYLKLPDYSSKQIMAEKLRIAAVEGQRSFHLS